MKSLSNLTKITIILLWLVATLMAARWVDNWRISKNYADLLPPSAQRVLAAQETIKIDVFALPDSAAAKLVDNFLAPLTAAMKAVEINHIDTSHNIELVKLYGIQKQGEMVVHKGEQNFHLAVLSYEAFFNGLKRLDLPQKKWIVFFDNLSSHDFSRNASLHGYSDWLDQLLAVNYQATVLSWETQMQLPEQVKLLVLAAPATALTDNQMQWLQSQIVAGRSVLWLTDPKYAATQPALSLLFDVMRTDAFHQGQVVLKNYPEHMVNLNFDRPMDLNEVMPFETANQPLWVNDQGQVLAATQQLSTQQGETTTSRLMVVGDSDFLSKPLLNSGGNLEMSFRMIDWLLYHDQRIDLPTIGTIDTQIHFSTNEILWFAGIMLILIPLLFLFVAIHYWRKSK